MRYREEDLTFVDLQVAKAEALVAKQRAVVSRLAAQGQGTKLAEQLLIEFESSLRDHIAHRELVREDLEESVAAG